MIVWFFALWSSVTPESDFGTCTSSVAKSQFKKDSLEKIAKLVGKNFKGKSDTDEEFEMNLCGDGVLATSGADKFVAIQQTSNFEAEKIVLGVNNDMTASSGEDWVLLTFFGGDPYEKGCDGQKRKSLVVVTCPSKGHSDGDFVLLNEDNESHDCMSTFELHSDQLCRVGFWGGFGILVFILAIILAVYFAIGIALNRCRGAQGCNQVPHLGFWSSLGHRLADISDYLCRCQGPPEDDLAASLQNDDEAILPM